MTRGRVQNEGGLGRWGAVGVGCWGSGVTGEWGDGGVGCWGSGVMGELGADRTSTRLNSSHANASRMPSSA